jgi:hypothetical protein
MAAAPSARRASPSARGRSRRRATDGGGTQPTPETSVASQPATGLGTPTVQPKQGEPGWVGNIKRLAGRPWMRLPPRRAHPHPPAAGRGDGPRAAASGTRSALRHRTGAPGSIARRTCATGVQAARRHPVGVAARRRPWRAPPRPTLCNVPHSPRDAHRYSSLVIECIGDLSPTDKRLRRAQQFVVSRSTVLRKSTRD